MRQTLIAGAALLILAACGARGASDRDAIVESCSNDEAEAACVCMADAMKDKLSPALFKKVADTARNGDTPADVLPTLTLDQQQQFAKVLPDLMACAVGANGN